MLILARPPPGNNCFAYEIPDVLHMRPTNKPPETPRARWKRTRRGGLRPSAKTECHPERALPHPVILSERSESKDLPNYGEPIALQRQNKMSFRAVADGVASSPDGEILPIAVWSRISPALEQDERLPQPARPFDCAQGDAFFVFAGAQSVRRNQQDSTGAERPLNDILFHCVPHPAFQADAIRPYRTRPYL